MVESLVKEATAVAQKFVGEPQCSNGWTGRKSELPFEESRYAQCANPCYHVDTVVLNEQGIDNIEFLFDANKSDRFEPLKKVASGGELSRLMLCIKSLVAQSMDMPTLLFDEIDSGISGEAARQVGIILKELSRKRQVICITHQPQIAGKGDAHFYVYKEQKGETVNTKIRLLDKEGQDRGHC